MPNVEPPLTPKEEEQGRRTHAVLAALYHADFPLVLKQESHEKFEGWLAAIIDQQRSAKIGEFLVQFFVSLERRRNGPAIAVVYDFVVKDVDTIELQTKGAVFPRGGEDITETSEFATVSKFVMDWDDVRDTFSASYDAHLHLDHIHEDDLPPLDT